jgi:hypothetical protein
LKVSNEAGAILKTENESTNDLCQLRRCTSLCVTSTFGLEGMLADRRETFLRCEIKVADDSPSGKLPSFVKGDHPDLKLSATVSS